MAISSVTYPADGVQDEFDVPFEYISRTHVVAVINGQDTVFPSRWTNDSRVKLPFVPPAGASVTIRRNTPLLQPLVDFQNGAVLTEEELDLAVRQLLFNQQELFDLYDGSLVQAQQRLAGNLGITTNPEQVANELAALILENQLLDTFQQRITDIDTNAQDIIGQIIRVDALQQTVDGISDVNGTGIGTFILQEQANRIQGDQALQTQLNLIGAVSGDSLSWILDLDTIKVDATTSLAQRFTSISAEAAADSAAITAEQSARANADSAIASDLALLGAKTGDGSAWILDESTVTVSGGTESLGVRLSGIDTSLGDNAAAIVTEQTARAAADTALASDITTLQTTVGTNTASITTLQSTTDGLSARYGVSLDVNGYVTGFLQNNDGQSGSFTILADKFAVVDPGGGTPFVPFEISGGVVRIKEAVIGSLSVDKLADGNLGAVMNLGTGRIVLDNGVYIKAIGVGFGSANQFLEWFGPKVAFSAMTEANAIAYIKTNGDAYYGGALSAGTLFNSAQATAQAVGTSAVLGPYGTNGGPITITASYSWSRSGTRTADPNPTVVTPSAEVRLYRTLGTGPEQLVRVETYTGTFLESFFPEPPSDPYHFGEGISGSFTITDTLGGTQDRTYRLEVVSRTIVFVGGASSNPDQISQRLSLTSTEE